MNIEVTSVWWRETLLTMNGNVDDEVSVVFLGSFSETTWPETMRCILLTKETLCFHVYPPCGQYAD